MENYSKEEVNKLLEDLRKDIVGNLRFETTTNECYTGGLDGSGVLYREYVTVNLYYGNEVIDSIDIN